ncbi:NB-ARC domain-containing protein [Micromonospora sp. M12]
MPGQTSPFGDRLRASRRAAGLTIEQLAERSGVSARPSPTWNAGTAAHRRPVPSPLSPTGWASTVTAGPISWPRRGRPAPERRRPSPALRATTRRHGLRRPVCRTRDRPAHREARRRERRSAAGPRRARAAGTGQDRVGGPGRERPARRLPRRLPVRRPARVDATPLPAGDALLRLLRALGVQLNQVADSDDERSAHLRGILRDRRCLLVLDNAGSEAQVRPLLPAGGRCLVVVTSRRTLGGLEGVLRIALPPLAPEESADLLRSIARQAADPQTAPQVDRVTDLCGHLPLALRIAGTRLSTRPHWTVRHLVDRLADAGRRLAALSTGDTGVATAFALSYAQLPAPAPSCSAASPSFRPPTSRCRSRRRSSRPRRPTPRTAWKIWWMWGFCRRRASTGTGSTT